MIFSYQVKQHAEKHIESVLRSQPRILKIVMSEPAWSKWCELLHVRCNQLDVEGYVPSNWAMYDFIEKATNTYAHKVLTKLEESFVTKNSKENAI